jgi:hypothetical protein
MNQPPDEPTPDQPLPVPDTGPHAAPPLEEPGTDANGSPVAENPVVLAGEQMFKPHEAALPGQGMTAANHVEANEAANRTRTRLIRGASAAFAEAYKIPADHIVVHELSSIDPDGTHHVRFYLVNQNEAEEKAMDADLRLALYFKGLGWRWREDGALMRGCEDCSKGKSFTPACPRGGDCNCGCSACDGLGEFVERPAPVADA